MNQDLGIDQVVELVLETGLCVSLFTAQKPTGAQGPSGSPTGAFNDVAGLINLHCMAPPSSVTSIAANQQRTISDTQSLAPFHLWIAGYYPALKAGWRGTDPGATGPWRAVVSDNDGADNPVNPVQFDLLGVEHDSQRQMTRVEMRLATT